MAGMIPRNFIDELIIRVDIVEVIKQYIPLKKQGREFTACCPFHNEKTPSFTVSPSKQFYHCFGCGAHGSVISFLMEHDNLEFVEAIESLANLVGLDVPREQMNTQDRVKYKQSKNIYALLAAIARYYQGALSLSSEAKRYFLDRGLNETVIERFSLGYAPNGWNTMIDNFTTQFSKEALFEAGVLSKNEQGRQYDRFRSRIMFPIRNGKGHIVAFGGRVISDDDEPKYLNSPETAVFHKGKELYGLYEAKQSTPNLDKLLVVEGYMDVIALSQFEIMYSVATLGTATTSEHIQQLFRLVDTVIFCFDGDKAGRKAAWRALNNTLPVLKNGKEVRFLFLPDKDDPDSYVRRLGKDAFEQCLLDNKLDCGDNYQSLSGYCNKVMREKFNLSSDEGKANYFNEMKIILAKMPDIRLKEQMSNNLLRLYSIDDAYQYRIPYNAKKTLPQVIGDQVIRRTPIRFIITLLLVYPKFVSLIENVEELCQYELQGISFLSRLVETIEENPHINSAGLIERWRGTQYESVITQLLSWEQNTTESILQQEFIDALKQLHKQGRESRLETLLFKAQNNDLNRQEKMDLKAILKSFSKH